MANYAGIRGDITVSGVALHCTKWSATSRVALLESTNKASGGAETYLAGKTGLDFSAEANFDASINSGSPPIPIANQGTTVVLSVNDSSDSSVKTISFTGFIESMSIDSAMDGIVTYSISGKSSGVVTWT